jgi:hypothetical protein
MPPANCTSVRVWLRGEIKLIALDTPQSYCGMARQHELVVSIILIVVNLFASGHLGFVVGLGSRC